MEKSFQNGLEIVLEHLQKGRALGRHPKAPSLELLGRLNVRPSATSARVSEDLVEPKVSAVHRAATLSPVQKKEPMPRPVAPAAPTPTAAAPVIHEAFVPVPLPTALDEAEKKNQLATLSSKVATCVQCAHLAANRNQVVFGVGNPNANLMFVGEAPGADEDRLGEPFVGKAGELLTRIIGAMGLSREEIYIANVLKCRPDMPAGEAGNRPPTESEMSQCLPYLIEQIRLIQPKVLVALGATAVKGIVGRALPITRIRGKWMEFEGIPLMPTYHPSYLLHRQSIEEKRKVWEDMLIVMETLEMPISQKQKNFFRK